MRHFPHYTRFPPAEWRWPNFKPAEMACRGTGQLGIDDKAMDALQRLRDEIGKPFIIHSAFRSESHNKVVGGAKNSQHLYARAFDVSMLNHDPELFEQTARACGFNGIGHYPKQNFMHIDTRPTPARWNSGGWFERRQTRFAPEPKPKVKTEAAISTATVIAAGPIIETALRELAPQLSAEWHGYAMGGAVLVSAFVGIFSLLRKRSTEPEA